jgi:hypothetical protein
MGKIIVNMKKKILKSIAKLFGIEIYFNRETEIKYIYETAKIQKLYCKLQHSREVPQDYINNDIIHQFSKELNKLGAIHIETNIIDTPYGKLFESRAQLNVIVDNKINNNNYLTN